MELTSEDIKKFEAWIIANVNDRVVPGDEGNSEALIFNLVHLVRGDGERYNYLPHQDKEIESWGLL